MPHLKIDTANAGQTEIIAAPGVGKHLRVMGYVLTGATAVVTAKWQSASTDKTGPMSFAAGPVVAPIDNGDGWMATADNEALNLFLNSAIQVSGHLVYRIIGG